MANVLQQPEDRILDELVVRARSERDAFGQLYDQIYPPVFRYCIRRTADRSLAEDIVSTVFLNVTKKLATFPGDTYLDFRRWVFVIATNELNANYRKSERRQALLIEAAESGRLHNQLSDEASSSTFNMDSVQAAIMRLEQRDQAIITLRFFSELPYEDVGHILNISSGAARTAASRALDKIRTEVGR